MPEPRSTGRNAKVDPERVKRLFDMGLSLGTIAARLGCAKSTVQNALREARTKETLE